MEIKLSNLFKTKNTPVASAAGVAGVSTDADCPSSTPINIFASPTDRQEGETYVNFGKRACMYTTGNPSSLRAYLQRIYQSEKARQLHNTQLQEQQRREIEGRLNDVDISISNAKSRLNVVDIEIKDNDEKLNGLKSDIAELKIKEGQTNRMPLVKFYLGLLILAILTVYLFIFYSSTFYSAFIQGPSSVTDAMFNSQALPDAFSRGIMSGLFLITVPIIFLGLGYGLHYFMEQKSSSKYFKVGVLVIITFMFDCILAIKIAESLYNLIRANTWEDTAPFTISMAFADLNVWAVIFCGFIVYMIWAVVFDMTISAYDDCKSNRRQIASLSSKIQVLNSNKVALSQKAESINGEISQLVLKKEKLKAQLNQGIFSITLIRQAFAEFFSGWNSIIGAVGLATAPDCNQIYEIECKSFFGVQPEITE